MNDDFRRLTKRFSEDLRFIDSGGLFYKTKTCPFVFRVSIKSGQLGLTDSLFVPSASGG